MPGYRAGLFAFVLLLVGHGCGGSTEQCIGPSTHFSPAAVSVDPNKQMADLTTDELASLCAEFTRSLNASYGTVEIECKFGSHAGNRQGTSTCQAWYDQCLQTPAPDTLTYCTSAMGGFQYNCRVTVGQYQACYNERYGTLLTGLELAAACGPIVGQSCTSACSGEAGRCDYTWFD